MKETKFKLIKISDAHYIVVNDSEIKEGDWCLDINSNKLFECLRNKKDGIYEWHKDASWVRLHKNCKKITHSTQPLEGHDYLWRPLVKQLSLSEVEELIFGYSVEMMAKKENPVLLEDDWDKNKQYRDEWINGFKAHQSLTKDKLFTVEDMINAYREGTNAGACYESLIDYDSPDSEAEEYSETEFNDFKQSLLPKTEWDVTFDEDGKLKLV